MISTPTTRPRRRFARLSCYVLLAAPALVCAQQVYKWTDSAGTVHYSERPPARHAQVLHVVGDSPAVAAEDAVAEASKAIEQGKSELDRVDHEQRQRMCAKARNNQQLLDSPAMVLGSGNINTAAKLTDEQRDAARVETTQQIGAYCNE